MFSAVLLTRYPVGAKWLAGFGHPAAGASPGQNSSANRARWAVPLVRKSTRGSSGPISSGAKRSVTTCWPDTVVHQVIQAAVLPLDELKDAGDRFIAVDVDLDDFEGARRGGDVVAELRGGGRALLRRSGSEKNVVLCVGGEERFDGLVADAGVGACYEGDSFGGYCLLLNLFGRG
ncbi:hypothetical protein KNSL1_009554 [Colletotrichum chrysophilum]|nr:hypothetical protein KNSL1_009554 [Colletotrichum chrysophilum]